MCPAFSLHPEMPPKRSALALPAEGAQRVGDGRSIHRTSVTLLLPDGFIKLALPDNLNHMLFTLKSVTRAAWTLSSISKLSGCLPHQNTVDKLLNSIKALSQNHQRSYFSVVTSLEHMCPVQTILSCRVLKRMHMLTTFCLSDVSKSYPLIVRKTPLLKIISKASKDKAVGACSRGLGEAGSRQQ